MKKSFILIAGVVCSLSIATSSLADGGFQAHMGACVDKFAAEGEGASVVLECAAADGKLSDCKVVENSAPSKGFDKAALCVAAFLPIGSKTGTIRVPLKFAGA